MDCKLQGQLFGASVGCGKCVPVTVGKNPAVAVITDSVFSRVCLRGLSVTVGRLRTVLPSA